MESQEGVAIFCGDEDSRGWIRTIILAVILLQIFSGLPQWLAGSNRITPAYSARWVL